LQTLLALLYKFACLYWQIFQPVSLGVTAIITNESGEIMLVRHGYRKGWFLPGGGVQRGESIEQSLARELYEEVGIRIIGEPKLFFGPHYRRFNGKHDHVFCYKVESWEQEPDKVPNLEVVEAKFFSYLEIPDMAGELTRTQVAAFMEQKECSNTTNFRSGA